MPAPPPADTTVAPTDVAELTRQLRRWTMRNGHAPQNFQEFAANAGFQIPPPPPGMKYDIKTSNLSVVLVKQ
jgi:hypothetical protein